MQCLHIRRLSAVSLCVGVAPIGATIVSKRKPSTKSGNSPRLRTRHFAGQKTRARIAHNRAAQPTMVLASSDVKVGGARGTPRHCGSVQPRNKLLFLLLPIRPLESQQAIQADYQLICLGGSMVQSLATYLFVIVRVRVDLARILGLAYVQIIFFVLDLVLKRFQFTFVQFQDFLLCFAVQICNGCIIWNCFN